MLETTLSTAFVPGSNIKGKVAGANWTFLLPDLNLDRVVSIGTPTIAALSTLSSLSQDIIVSYTQADQVEQIKALGQKFQSANIRPVAFEDILRLPDHTVDLILINHGSLCLKADGDQALHVAIKCLLKPGGFLYFELTPPGNRLQARLSQMYGASYLLWLTPLKGEMHTATLLNDTDTIHYFLQHQLYSSTVKLPLFRRLDGFINKQLSFNRFARRYGLVLASENTPSFNSPPQYLRSIAGSAGLNLDSYRWGLSARGDYSSRKILFYLFNGSDKTPTYIAKMVRDPVFNTRLENEHRALLLLQQKGIGTDETLPQSVFFGYHHDLAVIGETIVEGTSFSQQTQATADCPHGRAAANWLIELGAATADPTAATPEQVAQALTQLFKQATKIYHLSPGQQTFLKEQIARIAHHRGALPLVFQHGDPGTWNILATKAKQTVFLDWEAAEPQGMPLWDLFYFLRSYAVLAARKKGVRNSLTAFIRQLLAETDLNQFLIQATDDYCRGTGLDRDLVEPLFFTCWMHRALKEATRLPSTRLENGHYINLLKLCIEQRRTPALNLFFGDHHSVSWRSSYAT